MIKLHLIGSVPEKHEPIPSLIWTYLIIQKGILLQELIKFYPNLMIASTIRFEKFAKLSVNKYQCLICLLKNFKLVSNF